MATMIENKEVSFGKQFNGYDKGQVDRYVDSLTKAYQTAYDEYKAVCGKYNSLLEDFNELEAKEAQRPAAEIITKTLVDAETMASKIISDANTESEMIIKKAQDEAKRITGDAYTEKAALNIEAQKALDEAAIKTENANKTAKVIIEHANLEALKANENARKIVDYACIEASQITAQANKEREAAREALESAIENMQNILGLDCIANSVTGGFIANMTDAQYVHQQAAPGLVC